MTSIEDHGSHVTNTYSDVYFFGGGAGYPNYLDEKDILINRGQYYAKLLSKHTKKRGKVFDVGAAAGFILKGFIDSGWEGSGIEVNENMAYYARVNLGLDVKASRIEDYQIQNTFDLVSFIQVIGHLINPFSALKKASKALSNNGYILIETWNFKSITAKLFGRRWHEYSPPSVIHWFSKESLNFLMHSLHFELVAAGRPDKRLSFKHAKSLIKYKFKNSVNFRFINFLLRVFPDDWTVGYPGNDLFWALYKKKK